ncbi:hypothetical protein J2S22_000464 [Rhodoplanes tepidamans]|uniref:Uncharacterized protein n=1 Tax=Rhodoplanes tepidamans TaxID=200616 RepID=A0ABT5J8C3_RHOTP|nr:hypothetical protein [Rhodoplanes tepidamans]MDC7785300.1 hypothetical protein [Rhodoplanes tepidamans]MDQ0353558.1 hypothetical protein [Rhodoplanes tepidamans]
MRAIQPLSRGLSGPGAAAGRLGGRLAQVSGLAPVSGPVSVRAAGGVQRLAIGLGATGLGAVGALALGAVAIGALAVGAFAIGRLSVRRARFDAVEIGDLTVRRLHLPETRPSRRPAMPAPEVTGSTAPRATGSPAGR